MSEQLVTIDGKVRTEAAQLGKGYCRKLRAQGKVPGNILDKAKSTPIELEAKLLSKAWQADKQFNLNLDGKVSAVRIQELQLNAVKRSAVHVDLMYV